MVEHLETGPRSRENDRPREAFRAMLSMAMTTSVSLKQEHTANRALVSPVGSGTL